MNTSRKKPCGEIAKSCLLLSDNRIRDATVLYVVPASEPGPITTGFSCFAKAVDSVSQHKRHGAAMSALALTLGVPAFARTTADRP